MLHFDLSSPVDMLWFGEFISPQKDWKHLTRRLFEYEMMIVTEGELYIADDDREYHVKDGEYLIMSPTRVQRGTRVCRCRFFWMHFRCDALPASVSLPPHAAYRDRENIFSLAHMLLRSEAEHPRSVRSRYLATQLLLELAEGHGKNAEDTSRRKQIIRSVKEFVTFHRFSEIRVRDIARELGYHEKYLSTVFHEVEGITLKKFLTETRLAEAKRLLLETDYTVTEVAYYLNFPSPHNFSRFFKQETGLTASEFRSTSSPETVESEADHAAGSS